MMSRVRQNHLSARHAVGAAPLLTGCLLVAALSLPKRAEAIGEEGATRVLTPMRPVRQYARGSHRPHGRVQRLAMLGARTPHYFVVPIAHPDVGFRWVEQVSSPSSAGQGPLKALLVGGLPARGQEPTMATAGSHTILAQHGRWADGTMWSYGNLDALRQLGLIDGAAPPGELLITSHPSGDGPSARTFHLAPQGFGKNRQELSLSPDDGRNAGFRYHDAESACNVRWGRNPPPIDGLRLHLFPRQTLRPEKPHRAELWKPDWLLAVLGGMPQILPQLADPRSADAGRRVLEEGSALSLTPDKCHTPNRLAKLGLPNVIPDMQTVARRLKSDSH